MELLCSKTDGEDFPIDAAKDSKLFCILMSMKNTTITILKLSFQLDRLDMSIWSNILIDPVSTPRDLGPMSTLFPLTTPETNRVELISI